MKFTSCFLMLFFSVNASLAASLESVDKQKEALKTHQKTIYQAFKKGLGVTLSQQDKITMVAGGFSKADLFQVTTAQGDFIVKIMKDSPVEDIETEILAAQITGDSNVGPKLYYGDVATKTLLLSYIDNTHKIDRRATPFHKLVATEIRRFHSGNPLERNTRFFDILRQDEQRLVAHHFVSTLIQKEDQDLYLKMIQEVEKIFAHFAEDIRPVHHDLSPHNVLYDKTKAWLIDWETASNDYYPIDLCMFANFHVYDESLLPHFMTAYYQRKPTALEMAKFHVIRPFCYAFHGFRLAFLANQKTLPKMGEILEYKDFQLAIRHGKVELGSPVSLFTLGVSTMNKAISMLREKDFQRGLKTLQTHLKTLGVSL